MTQTGLAIRLAIAFSCLAYLIPAAIRAYPPNMSKKIQGRILYSVTVDAVERGDKVTFFVSTKQASDGPPLSPEKLAEVGRWLVDHASPPEAAK